MSEINSENKMSGLFKEAVELLNDGFYFDGINKFNELIKLDPKGDLADDAQFNIGLCYLKMNIPKQAIEHFEKVISDYPDSTIAYSDENKEYGRTPAKAYLGLINCYLQLGNQDKTQECLSALSEFEDSYVLQEDKGVGKKVTYYQLAKEMIAAVKKEESNE